MLYVLQIDVHFTVKKVDIQFDLISLYDIMYIESIVGSTNTTDVKYYKPLFVQVIMNAYMLLLT